VNGSLAPFAGADQVVGGIVPTSGVGQTIASALDSVASSAMNASNPAALAAGPQSLEAIEDALLRAHGAEPDGATREAIADTLRVMSSLGLVEPLPAR
jgi:hypothetical protein